MKYCTNKDIDQLVRQLIRQRWVFQNGGKHGRLTSPDGLLTSPDGLLTLTVSRSPSDSRCLYNLRRDLRKGILSVANMRVL